MRNVLNISLKEYLRTSLETIAENEYSCKGWQYLRENICVDLQGLIQTEEYKKIFYNDPQAAYLEKMTGAELDEAEKQQLKSFVYVQKDLERKEARLAYKNQMLAEGWLELSEDVVKKAIEGNKRIQLTAEHTNDWLTTKVDKVLKPKLFNTRNGQRYGLMELRARSRGYSLMQFDRAFCKLI